jgi:hypothetical protein
MLAALYSRYTMPSADRIAREVARRQRARLARTAAPARRDRRPSRWSHVPLAELFTQAGNQVYARGNGNLETGHEPVHTSKSARCLQIDPASGYWWCRGCRRGGDAIAAVRGLLGLEYRAAVAYLTRHYGRPPHAAGAANVTRQRLASAPAVVRKLVVEVGPCD